MNKEINEQMKIQIRNIRINKRNNYIRINKRINQRIKGTRQLKDSSTKKVKQIKSTEY